MASSTVMASVLSGYTDLGLIYTYDDLGNPDYLTDDVRAHTRWAKRHEGRKMSNWYRDPKLAKYLVWEDRRARPHKFEWDPEPRVAFGGRKYPVEPMPCKVKWRATNHRNDKDTGRSARIPLPRKSSQWQGPDNLGPRAAELKAVRAAAAELKAAQDAEAPSTSGRRSSVLHSAPRSVASEGQRGLNFRNMSRNEQRAWKESERRRKRRDRTRERQRADIAQLERMNEKAWAEIHRQEASRLPREERQAVKRESKKAQQQAKAAKKQMVEDRKRAKRQLKQAEKEQRRQQKLVEKEQKKQRKQQRRQKVKGPKNTVKARLEVVHEAWRATRRAIRDKSVCNKASTSIADATASIHAFSKQRH